MCLKLKKKCNVEFQWGSVFHVHSSRTHVVHMGKTLCVLLQGWTRCVHLVRMTPAGNLSMHLHRPREDMCWAGPSWFICVVSGLLWWSGNVQLHAAVQWMWGFDAPGAPVGRSPELQQSTGEDNQRDGLQAVWWDQPLLALRTTLLCTWVPLGPYAPPGETSPQVHGCHPGDAAGQPAPRHLRTV